jgi:hypothetical protein
MHLLVPLTVITFLMPQVADAQLVRHNSIPETYWGTWAPADANCQDAKKSSIALSAQAYETSTTSCVVKYVRRNTWAQSRLKPRIVPVRKVKAPGWAGF